MFTIYWTSTGEILRTTNTPTLAPGESKIEGEYSASTHYVKDGLASPLPPCEFPGLVFDHLIERWVPVAGLNTHGILNVRDRLLTNSDWTQLPDVNLQNKQAWLVYRQALRDITAQPGYPLRVLWPTKPE